MIKKPTISLCLIVKSDDREAEALDRCLSFVAHVVDEVCITVTGDNGKVAEVAKKYHAKVSRFEWVNDFAAARNFNFSQATSEYVIWCDADDAIRGVEHLDEILTQMSEKGIDAGVMDYLYHFDENKLCDVKQRRTRIVKNDGCVKWFGELHEDLLHQRELNSYFIEDIQVLHLTDDERNGESKVRNYQISVLALEKHKDDNSFDPTLYWNAANASVSVEKKEEALHFFIKFIESSHSEDEVALAYLRMSDCYMDLSKFDDAKSAAAQVIVSRPWFPDGYLKLGEIYFKMNDYRRAKEFLITGLTKEVPKDEHIVWEPRNYDYYPLMLLSECYLELGKPDEAKKCIEECIRLLPNKRDLKVRLEAVKEAIKKLDKVDEICKRIEGEKDIEKIKYQLGRVPEELQSHPKIAVLRNQFLVKKTSSGKDLAIFCYATGEEFNPDIVMKKGMGGSEEAVVHLSKKLHDLGWNVTVYANCGTKEMEFSGVHWKPYWLFNPNDKWDKTIFWRHPLIVGYKEMSGRDVYVWMHDVLRENEFTRERLDNIKKIIVLSRYQRNLFPKVPDDKFFISSNGIDSKLFKSKRGVFPRNPHRLIWTSSYDRGLLTLLQIFPFIRKKVPDAQLHIFYGWNVWDTMYSHDPGMQKRKREIEELMKQDGVFHHGRVSQEQIADEYFKSGILAYPTEFTEISFITGMKAQAAGAIPVTTGIYAIDETVQYGTKIISDKIYSDLLKQQEFVDAVVGWMTMDSDSLEKYRKKMMDWACDKYNWDKVAESWNRDLLGKK